jgi:hypothetical protein
MLHEGPHLHSHTRKNIITHSCRQLHTYMRAHTHTHTHTHAQTYIHYIYTCTHSRTHNTQIRKQTHTCTHMRTQKHTLTLVATGFAGRNEQARLAIPNFYGAILRAWKWDTRVVTVLTTHHHTDAKLSNYKHLTSWHSSYTS